MKKKNRIVMWMAILCLAAVLCMGCGADSQDPEVASVSPESGGDASVDANTGGKDDTSANADTEADSGTEKLKTEDSDADADMEPDLIGDVVEISEDRFEIAKITTEEIEGGGEVMVSSANPEADEARITVVYGDDTVFTLRTIRDGGASYEDTKSSAADLEEGKTVYLAGSYEGSEFHAKAVRITDVL